jgi:hypothetical protein
MASAPSLRYSSRSRWPSTAALDRVESVALHYIEQRPGLEAAEQPVTEA